MVTLPKGDAESSGSLVSQGLGPSGFAVRGQVGCDPGARDAGRSRIDPPRYALGSCGMQMTKKVDRVDRADRLLTICELLRDGPLTDAELKTRLVEKGFKVSNRTMQRDKRFLKETKRIEDKVFLSGRVALATCGDASD